MNRNASKLQTAAADALDLSQMTVLIADPDQHAVELIGRILRGFGLKAQTVADSGEAAMRLLAETSFALLLVEAVLPDMLGGDLVKWLRRREDVPLRFVPVIVLTGHTRLRNIECARDSGANYVVKKPIAHATLFDRITWSAKSERPFVETPNYAGPDRRFRSIGPPDGAGRRISDLPAEIGIASEPNLSQSEIDSFIKPVKIRVD